MQKFTFWNPEHVSEHLPDLNGYTCTMAELGAAEAATRFGISTTLELVNAEQADAILVLAYHECNHSELRYEEWKE